MRYLLYVPIVHEEVDMGSLGPALTRGTTARSGQVRWNTHRATMASFWEGVANYLMTLGPPRLKIYQDGLTSDGVDGRRIAERAASQGSRNYQLILDLLNHGAELRRTEDLALLLQERRNLLDLVGSRSTPGVQCYHRERDRLMAARDRSIAQAINTTLKEDELGVLFIGAYHHVAPYLDKDISVQAVKDREKVQAYFQELVSGQDQERFQQLALYLTSPAGLL